MITCLGEVSAHKPAQVVLTIADEVASVSAAKCGAQDEILLGAVQEIGKPGQVGIAVEITLAERLDVEQVG